MENKNILIIYGIILVIFGGIFFAYQKGVFSGTKINYDEFAKCVASKNVTMYGAAWCPHCQREKALFGSSFQYIPYVECPDNAKLCLDKGVTGYPSWIDGEGKKYEGEQGLEGIAKISGCVLPQ